MNYDWNDLAFGNKKTVNDLNAIFIAAPRDMSAARFKQILRQYLPQGNVLLGLAKEPYILGFESQPQFTTLQQKTVQPLIDRVNQSQSKYKIYTLGYFQRDLVYIIEKLKCSHVLLVNGSWQHSFHVTPAYYAMASKQMPYTLISPFADETEARAFGNQKLPTVTMPPKGSAAEMMQLCNEVARQSYDHTMQVGTVLAAKKGTEYKPLAASCNIVLPYPTHALHFGSQREQHFSSPNDQNYYDAIHAEMSLLVSAQKQRLSLANTTLFINVLPCPACGKALSMTDITEIVYTLDHSDGQTVKLLGQMGKRVRRLT